MIDRIRKARVSGTACAGADGFGAADARGVHFDAGNAHARG